MSRVPPEELARVTKTAVAMVVTRFKGKRLPVAVDLDDLLQAARIGVFVASERFDASRGVSFMTIGVGYGMGYALCAIGDGTRVGRSRFSRNRESALANEFLSLDDRRRLDGHRFHEHQPDPRAEAAFRACEVVDLLAQLPQPEREICARIILCGDSAAEVARDQGVSRTAAGDRWRRGVKRIREAVL